LYDNVKLLRFTFFFVLAHLKPPASRRTIIDKIDIKKLSVKPSIMKIKFFNSLLSPMISRLKKFNRVKILSVDVVHGYKRMEHPSG
jgi:hypothetical protein